MGDAQVQLRLIRQAQSHLNRTIVCLRLADNAISVHQAERLSEELRKLDQLLKVAEMRAGERAQEGEDDR